MVGSEPYAGDVDGFAKEKAAEGESPGKPGLPAALGAVGAALNVGAACVASKADDATDASEEQRCGFVKDDDCPGGDNGSGGAVSCSVQESNANDITSCEYQEASGGSCSAAGNIGSINIEPGVAGSVSAPAVPGPETPATSSSAVVPSDRGLKGDTEGDLGPDVRTGELSDVPNTLGRPGDPALERPSDAADTVDGPVDREEVAANTISVPWRFLVPQPAAGPIVGKLGDNLKKLVKQIGVLLPAVCYFLWCD